MTRWTETDLSTFQRNSGRKLPAATLAEMAKTARPKNKYGAHATMVRGQRFDSKLEAKRFKELCLLERAGEVLYFQRQVPFDLSGGVKYRCDFMVVRQVGSGTIPPAIAVTITYEDCKGYETQAGKNKIKQVEDLYPVKIELLRKAKR